jgi:hypothetical protein
MDVVGTGCLKRFRLLGGAGSGGGEAGSEDEDDGVRGESAAGLDDDGAGVGTGVPKGVSSSFTLEEDATWPVAGMCVGRRCMAERARWLRVCDDRWVIGGTVRNWPEADMDGAGVAVVAVSWPVCSMWTLYVETHGRHEVWRKRVVSVLSSGPPNRYKIHKYRLIENPKGIPASPWLR